MTNGEDDVGHSKPSSNDGNSHNSDEELPPTGITLDIPAPQTPIANSDSVSCSPESLARPKGITPGINIVDEVDLRDDSGSELRSALDISAPVADSDPLSYVPESPTELKETTPEINTIDEAYPRDDGGSQLSSAGSDHRNPQDREIDVHQEAFPAAKDTEDGVDSPTNSGATTTPPTTASPAPNEPRVPSKPRSPTSDKPDKPRLEFELSSSSPIWFELVIEEIKNKTANALEKTHPSGPLCGWSDSTSATKWRSHSNNEDVQSMSFGGKALWMRFGYLADLTNEEIKTSTEAGTEHLPFDYSNAINGVLRSGKQIVPAGQTLMVAVEMDD
jgi:hypothetical protein